MKKNENGFSLIAVLLVVVAISLVVGVGHYVYNSQKKTNTALDNAANSQSDPQRVETKYATQEQPKTKDEIADWVVFTSSKGWTMKVPDGWELSTNPSSEGLVTFGNSLTYQAGKRAAITKQEGGRGGPFLLNIANYAAGDPSTENPSYLTTETDFKANGVTGKKYAGILSEDIPMDGSKGDTVYRYIFVKDSKTVIANYLYVKGKPSNVAELEKALQTLRFN